MLTPALALADEPIESGLYAGWDIGRAFDLSVVWFWKPIADLLVLAGLLVMRNIPTPDQTERVSALMNRVQRLAIDKSGMGLPIYETMARNYPGKVDGVQFTQQTRKSWRHP